jgi:hypothetical protein
METLTVPGSFWQPPGAIFYENTPGLLALLPTGRVLKS